MPRINESGDVAELRRDWFDATRTVYQDCTDGICRIVLSDGTVVADRGANTVVGGGGQWAGWLNLEEGVFDSQGRTWPLAGLGSMGPDGAYALKVRAHSFGPWDVIEADGSRWRLTEGDAADIQLLGSRQAIWTEGGWLRRTPGLPITTPGETVWWPRAAWNGERFVLLYQRQADSSLVLDGRVIAPSGNYFYPDVRVIDGSFHVVWSPNQADVDTHRLILTPDQLSRLPHVGDVVEPEPEPHPVPEPEPSMPNSLLSTVIAVRNKYPHPSHADLGKILNEIAWIHRADGWGVNLKPNGNNTPQPKTGKPIAVDILHHKPSDTLWDCFRDAGGATEPAWGEAEPHGDASRVWVAPVAPDGVQPQPEPEPEPSSHPDAQPVPVGVFGEILTELRKLNRHLGVR